MIDFAIYVQILISILIVCYGIACVYSEFIIKILNKGDEWQGFPTFLLSILDNYASEVMLSLVKAFERK